MDKTNRLAYLRYSVDVGAETRLVVCEGGSSDDRFTALHILVGEIPIHLALYREYNIAKYVERKRV